MPLQSDILFSCNIHIILIYYNAEVVPSKFFLILGNTFTHTTCINRSGDVGLTG